MKNSAPCCRHVESLAQAPSPFGKMVALGFYDGPTSGIMQCTDCSAVYSFDMLDWDNEHHVRVFRLSELPAESLEQIVKALSQNQSPRWPVWVPPWQWPSEQARIVAENAVQQVLGGARPPELLVALDISQDRVLAAARLPSGELSRASDWFSLADPKTAPDWFRALGLLRENLVA